MRTRNQCRSELSRGQTASFVHALGAVGRQLVANQLSVMLQLAAEQPESTDESYTGAEESQNEVSTGCWRDQRGNELLPPCG